MVPVLPDRIIERISFPVRVNMYPVQGVHGSGNYAVIILALKNKNALLMDHHKVDFRCAVPFRNVHIPEQRERSRDRIIKNIGDYVLSAFSQLFGAGTRLFL